MEVSGHTTTASLISRGDSLWEKAAGTEKVQKRFCADYREHLSFLQASTKGRIGKKLKKNNLCRREFDQGA